MSNEEIVAMIKERVNDKGLKWLFVSRATSIPYQRINRIINQRATLSAVEFLHLCQLLDLDPNNDFNDRDQAS